MTEKPERVEVELDRIDVSELFSSMSLNEAEVLYDISGVTVEDFVVADPRSSEDEQTARDRRVEHMLETPRFKRAALTVLTMRRNPTITRQEAEEAVGDVNVLQVVIAMWGRYEDPPTTDSQKQPESGSDSSPPLSSGDSGSPSTTASDEPDNPQATTGQQPSDTSSPLSLATT